jgi:hypothetical protein
MSNELGKCAMKVFWHFEKAFLFFTDFYFQFFQLFFINFPGASVMRQEASFTFEMQLRPYTFFSRHKHN